MTEFVSLTPSELTDIARYYANASRKDGDLGAESQDAVRGMEA